MKRLIFVCIVMLLFYAVSAHAGTWTTLDKPGSLYDTVIRDIDGVNLAGNSEGGGFLYNGTTWTTLNKPGANQTRMRGINGSNLVGHYSDGSGTHGFLYNGTTWTALDMPGAPKTSARDIDNGNIVGEYLDTSLKSHGFIYNGTSWTSFDKPGADQTYLCAIDGSNLVGEYLLPSSGWHAFFYDGTNYTTLIMPEADYGTWVEGISENNIVGYYEDISHNCHGFLYNGITWTTLDMPGAKDTFIYGIDGNKLVGAYKDVNFVSHGFVYEISEPPIVCIADVNQPIEAQGLFGAKVTFDGSCSSDADSSLGTNDDINDFDWYSIDPCDPNNDIYLGSGQILDCNLPLGTNTIILEVTDKAGLSDSNEITIIVRDTTPPDFELSVSPEILWPANHKMVKVTPTWTVSDLCGESPEVSLVDITISESGNANDIQITGDELISLCATRSGNSTGRVYTLIYQACDDSGNCTTKSATVTIPHDNRK